MATYVNNLRLKEIATGDESGTWGNRTNENLELIGEALGYGTEAITTNADLHTTTVSNGATAPGRAMYLKYTGTLDSACTITLAPNTISKLWFIEDDKRMCEKNSDFGDKFIKISREVHFLNDERSKIKLEVNNLTGSKIKEIKEYTSY